jgi:hypothetical protein
MDIFGVALITCGLSVIGASLIIRSRNINEAGSSESSAEVKPFVPPTWVDPLSDEALKAPDR